MVADFWYVGCSSRELRNKPLAVTLFEKPLVLFRDEAGSARALDDRCPHRNMPLSAGAVCGGFLQCGYHGWSFDGTGRLADIPALPNKSDWPSRVSVEAYPVLEQDGYVWVCPGGGKPEQAPAALHGLRESGWTTFRMDTLFRAPVEACLENFLDCPHAAYVHRHWFRTPARTPTRAVVRYREDGAEAEYFDEPRKKGIVWRTLARRQAGMRHIDRFIAPATSRVDYIFDDGRHYVITSNCTPLDADTTRVFTTISFRWPLFGSLVRLFFHPLSRKIIRQDVETLNRQHVNVRRFGGERYYFARSDLLIRAIMAWRDAMHDGGPTPAPGAEYNVDLAL